MLPNSLSWSRELGHPANPVRQPSDNGPPMGHQWATNGLYVAATSCVVFIAVFIIVPLGTATPTPAARSEPTQHQQTKTFSVRSTQYAVHIYPGNRRRAPTKKGSFRPCGGVPLVKPKKKDNYWRTATWIATARKSKGWYYIFIYYSIHDGHD